MAIFSFIILPRPCSGLQCNRTVYRMLKKAHYLEWSSNGNRGKKYSWTAYRKMPFTFEGSECVHCRFDTPDNVNMQSEVHTAGRHSPGIGLRGPAGTDRDSRGNVPAPKQSGRRGKRKFVLWRQRKGSKIRHVAKPLPSQVPALPDRLSEHDVFTMKDWQRKASWVWFGFIFPLEFLRPRPIVVHKTLLEPPGVPEGRRLGRRKQFKFPFV